LIRNQWVRGSIPLISTICNNALKKFRKFEKISFFSYNNIANYVADLAQR
jgi:hypothetical protein